MIKLIRRGSTFLDRHVAEAVRIGLDVVDLSMSCRASPETAPACCPTTYEN